MMWHLFRVFILFGCSVFYKDCVLKNNSNEWALLLTCIATSSWSHPMHMNAGGPTPRAAHTLCSYGQYLVIFGGRDTESRTNDLYIYDTGKQHVSFAMFITCMMLFLCGSGGVPV